MFKDNIIIINKGFPESQFKVSIFLHYMHNVSSHVIHAKYDVVMLACNECYISKSLKQNNDLFDKSLGFITH